MAGIFDGELTDFATQHPANAGGGVPCFVGARSGGALAHLQVVLSEGECGTLQQIGRGESPPALVRDEDDALRIDQRDVGGNGIEDLHLGLGLQLGGGFTGPLGREVGHREAQSFLALLVGRHRGQQLSPTTGAVTLHQAQFDRRGRERERGGRAGGGVDRQQFFKQEIKCVLILPQDVAGKWFRGQLAAGDAKQGGEREVGFEDQALRADGAVANGGEIVEVEIAGAGGGEFVLRPAQLLVLHFQLDLVDLQLVQQRARCFRRRRRQIRRRRGGLGLVGRFRLRAQLGGGGR